MRMLRNCLLTLLAIFSTFASSQASTLTTEIEASTYDSFVLHRAAGIVGIGIEWSWNEQVGAEGLTVTVVKEDSPAAKAGVLVNDKIVSVDGRIILGMNLAGAVALINNDMGGPTKLSITRGGSRVDLEVGRDNGLMGISYQNYSPSYYGKIEKVLPGSPAEKAGLQEADFILAVDHKFLGHYGDRDKVAFHIREGGALGVPVILTISRGSSIMVIPVKRGVIPNVEAKYGVQIFGQSLQTSEFSTKFWSELKLWNLSWVDMFNPETKVYQDQGSRNVLDSSLISLSHDTYLVWDLQRNSWGNDPDIAARLIARFMKKDGWVLSYRDLASQKLFTYQLNGRVLSKSVEGEPADKFEIVEYDIVRFDGKLSIVISDETSAGAAAIAYSLKLSNSATLVGRPTSGSLEIFSYENPQPKVYSKTPSGVYTMANGGGIGSVGPNVLVDRYSQLRTDTAAFELMKSDLKWWENRERLSTMVSITGWSILVFSVLCLLAVYAVPKDFLNQKVRNTAVAVVAVEAVIVISVFAFFMLVYAFWLCVIIGAVAVGFWFGRSSNKSEPEKRDDYQ